MRMKKSYGEIYLLPSFFSLMNMFFGFLSIVWTIQAKYKWGAFFIIFAAVLDGLDGIVARSTKTQSEFGKELDSLADAISFGAAPSLLLYYWGFKTAGPPGLFFSFLYLSAGVLRLARYNIRQKSLPDRRTYQGLTIPSSSMFLASLILFHPQPLETRLLAFLAALLSLVLAACMVSTMRYRNFLNFNFRQRIDLKTALVMAVIVCSLIFYTKIVLLSFFTVNVLSGPFNSIRNALREKRKQLLRQKEVSS